MKLILPDGKYLDELERSATWIHHQDGASLTWTVNHGLGKNPSVTCVDSSGYEIFGDVHYMSIHQVVISFLSTLSGKAYLN